MKKLDSRIAEKIMLALLMALCIVFCSFIGAIFTGLFIIALKHKEKFGRYSDYIVNFFWAIIVAHITYFIPCGMLRSEYLPSVNIYEWILNITCVFVFYEAVFLIVGKARVSVAIGSFLLVLLSTANAYIYAFRGKELGPMDFLSAKTAANVAAQYHFDANIWVIVGWVIWLLVICLQYKLPPIPKLPKLRSRIFALAALTVSVFALVLGAKNLPIKTWETEGTRLNGYYLNFYISIRDSKVKQPEGYSIGDVEACTQAYAAGGADTKIPNVIVIMDESFADMSVLGSEPKTNKEVTPFINSLKKNTVRGYALASVYGGNTANSEFEFLTGHSMAFLPKDTVPYQQYIKGDIYSLAWLMNSYGYTSVATHPYLSDGWSRPKIYPHIGFSSFSFIDEYPAERLLREYVSDREMFEYVADYINKTDEPLFLFGITMQNHGGYNYSGENYSKTISINNGNYPKAEQYLSLIHETDKAMEYFINELEKSSEDTVVLFFGDHMPNVENDFYDELHGSPSESLDEQMLKYKVPFIIWANYDIKEKTIDCTSLNYLSTYLLETAGLELSPYNKFLKDVEEVIPAVNAMGYYSVSKEKFIPVADADGREREWLKKYSAIQYNNLFDNKNRNYNFFERYIENEK